MATAKPITTAVFSRTALVSTSGYCSEELERNSKAAYWYIFMHDLTSVYTVQKH